MNLFSLVASLSTLGVHSYPCWCRACRELGGDLRGHGRRVGKGLSDERGWKGGLEDGEHRKSGVDVSDF